jgi:hypothetical protein
MTGCGERLRFYSVILIFSLLFIPPVAGEVTPGELEKIRAAISATSPVEPKKDRKLLIFTRTEGYRHASIPHGIKALELMGRQTGAFSTEQSEEMSVFAPESLNEFDAVCFCNTTNLDFPDPVHRKALLNFLRSGKGVIGIHSATDNFYNWPAGADLMGGQFDGHPWNAGGTWTVQLTDADHPLTAPFKGKGFEISDEIYRIKPKNLRENCHILCGLDMTSPVNRDAGGVTPNDIDLPISWVRAYGRGRVFYSSFGHNEHIYWNAAILQHYLAGIQFALGDLQTDTTPSLVDKNLYRGLLDRIKRYEYGKSREPVSVLTHETRKYYSQPNCLAVIEQLLLEHVRSDAGHASKWQACRLLREFAGDKTVAALGPLLADPEMADMARYAIENSPAKKVLTVFGEALHKANGNQRIAIIHAIGRRKNRLAVEDLAIYLSDPDTAVARAAASALGNIGGPEALALLTEAQENADESQETTITEAILSCADRLSKTRGRQGAFSIYETVYDQSTYGPHQAWALRGMIRSRRKEAASLIPEALTHPERLVRQMAINLVAEHGGLEYKRILELPAAEQVQLLTVLVSRRPLDIRLVALKLVTHSNEAVRVAAISALGKVSWHEDVPLLAEIAATTTGATRDAARHALSRMRSGLVDIILFDLIRKSPPNIQIELIAVAEKRHFKSGARGLLKLAAPGQPTNVAVASLKALRTLAAPSLLEDIVKLLRVVDDDTVRREAEKTAAVLIARRDDLASIVDFLKRELSWTKREENKVSMHILLCNTGSELALPALRAALNKPGKTGHAVLRGLGHWPDALPLPDLLQVARFSENPTRRTLAFRGALDLVQIESNRSVDETAGQYRDILEIANSDEEYRRLLAALAQWSHVEAVALIEPLLDRENIKEEAQIAVLSIAEKTEKESSVHLKDIVEKIQREAATNSVRDRANAQLKKQGS